ncbi:nucleotidyltransferase family protein [Halobacteriovorax sp. HLS]|uniref:nucleotidyltransferase family protein n=1 Tax=Halobacteriovorax sp. HLS TaxID=2234000 RepID=UPI000FD8CF4C|nr:nucleotidyltransferase family protein [Halobacteriovorax sp. HLS]
MISDVMVLVLAGGKGTRLSSVVSDVPKPMAPIGDKPFLYYVLKYLKKNDFRNICFLTGYKASVIENFATEYDDTELNLSHSFEDSPLGTGGAIKKAIEKHSDFSRFIVLNGDTFFDVDLKLFMNSCKTKYALALKKIEDCSRYGRVSLDEGLISEFIEKDSSLHVSGLINGGVYFLDKDVIKYIAEGFVSLESEVFPELIKLNALSGVEVSGNFLDIGIPEDYYSAQTLIPKWT